MRREESGFTLIELVITSTILGIVMSVIGATFYVFFRTTAETSERLAESPALQIASTYLTRDIQSADTTISSDCGGPATWAGGTELASFGWRDPGSTTQVGDNTAVVVSYVVATSAGSFQKRLDRYECSHALDAPGATVPVVLASPTKTTVVAFVDPTPAKAPSYSASANVATVAFSVCTAKATAAECNSGTSVPFTLAVTRRAA